MRAAVGYARHVQMDRWVVPPAVAAAVFTVVAVAPPVGGASERRGVRVEILGRVVLGRPLLVRAVLDDPARGGWLALPGAVLKLRDGTGAVTDAVRVQSDDATRWAAATLRVPTRGPFTLEIEGPNTRASCTLPTEAPPPRGIRSEDGAGALRVPAGTVLPGVATEVLVRAAGAASVALRPRLEGVTVTPPVATPDACGVARFEVLADLLGVPLQVALTSPEGVERAVERRLPMEPGAAQLLAERGGFAAQTVTADGVVWAAWGDDAGPLGWSVHALRAAEPEGPGLATLPAPVDVGWVALARGGDFRGAVFVPRGGAGRGCQATEAGRRWALGDAALPALEGPRLLIDGGSVARARAGARVRRVRGFASIGLALSVLAEAALVLGAGLQRDPISLRALVTPRRHRIGWALAIGLALFTMAGALLLTASIAGGG